MQDHADEQGDNDEGCDEGVGEAAGALVADEGEKSEEQEERPVDLEVYPERPAYLEGAALESLQFIVVIRPSRA